MRWSVEDTRHCAVYLDGHRVYAPQSADDEAGTVRAPLINADGKAVFDYSRGDFAVVERSGCVTMTLLPVGMPFSDIFRGPFTLDYPFRVAFAREGELAAGWHQVRFLEAPGA